MTRIKHIPFLIFLAALFAALPALSQEAPDERLQRLEERLGSRGSGLLMQYERGIGRLEDTLRKDEYLGLGRYVRNQILVPWREVDRVQMVSWAQSPPHNWDNGKRQLLMKNSILVRQVTGHLRRVRRMVTRAANMNNENRRFERELARTLQQWERQVAALQARNPEAAASHMDWMNRNVLPTLENLRSRDRQLQDRFDRLANWGEDGDLREWLDGVGEVSEAVQKLNRLFP